jgi:hypothetical protein
MLEYKGPEGSAKKTSKLGLDIIRWRAHELRSGERRKTK